MKTALLLTISNVFMTLAWYGHLASPKFKKAALPLVILVSWLIAFLEYCFQVPANRIGEAQGFTPAQLKIMQEVITLVVFVCFSFVAFPDQKIAWNHWVGFGLVLGAVFFVYYFK